MAQVEGETHRATLIVDGVPVETLADLPPKRGGILFVGLQPSQEGVAAGHYHPGPGGAALWRLLEAAGVLPPGTDPTGADAALAEAGHGITDLVKLPDGGDGPTSDDLRAGVGPLWQKIALWRPAAVVFVSHRAAEAAAGRPLPAAAGLIDDMALAGRPCLLMLRSSAGDEKAAIAMLRSVVAAIRIAAGVRTLDERPGRASGPVS